MSYATSTDLEARLAPDLLLTLTDDDGDETPDATVLAAALSDAAAQIDQSLGRRYVTPLDAPPEILTRWCVDLAIENLFLRKKIDLPREQADRLALTHRTLDAIESGLVGLAGATPKLDEQAAENSRRLETPTFSFDTMETF